MKPYKPYNENIVILRLTRGELCSVLLSLTATKQENPQAKRWGLLHEKLKAILDDFDEAHKERGDE